MDKRLRQPTAQVLTPSLICPHFLPGPGNHSLPPVSGHSNCRSGRGASRATGWRVAPATHAAVLPHKRWPSFAEPYAVCGRAWTRGWPGAWAHTDARCQPSWSAGPGCFSALLSSQDASSGLPLTGVHWLSAYTPAVRQQAWRFTILGVRGVKCSCNNLEVLRQLAMR